MRNKKKDKNKDTINNAITFSESVDSEKQISKNYLLSPSQLQGRNLKKENKP